LQICTAQIDSIGYFGQTPPGDTAVVFAPGIISMNGHSKTYITFTPDGNECYFSEWAADFSTAKIFYTKRENYIWSPQVEAPFSVGNYVACPFLTSDGVNFTLTAAAHLISGWYSEQTQDGVITRYSCSNEHE